MVGHWTQLATTPENAFWTFSMMSRSSARDSYAAKRPLLTIACCRTSGNPKLKQNQDSACPWYTWSQVEDPANCRNVELSTCDPVSCAVLQQWTSSQKSAISTQSCPIRTLQEFMQGEIGSTRLVQRGINYEMSRENTMSRLLSYTWYLFSHVDFCSCTTINCNDRCCGVNSLSLNTKCVNHVIYTPTNGNVVIQFLSWDRILA